MLLLLVVVVVVLVIVQVGLAVREDLVVEVQNLPELQVLQHHQVKDLMEELVRELLGLLKTLEEAAVALEVLVEMPQEMQLEE
jgi:hypothetical protein